MDPLSEATLVAGQGLEGSVDRSRRRQVTILSSEAWAAATAAAGRDPGAVARRANILVSGIDLAGSRGRVLRLGPCRVAIGGELTPCERMDEAAPGLRRALEPHWRGGVFGAVLHGGIVRVGDPAAWDVAVTLRRAQPSDAVDIAGLLRASWAAAYGSLLTADELGTIARELHAPDVLRRQMSNPRVVFHVARTNGEELAGIATLRGSEDGTTVSVLRLYVLPGLQGRGIGSQLLDQALADFPGAQRIELQVARGNPSGLSFWIKRGFHASGEEEARIGGVALRLIVMERG